MTVIKKILAPLSFSLAALLAATSGQCALKVGDMAPSFSVQAATNGAVSQFSLDEALKSGPVVVYFYPKAFTKGCSLEAHQFSEAIDQFKALGVTVIGLSADDIDLLKKFSMADCQGKFPVGSDPKAVIAGKYDAKLTIPGMDMSSRTSYLITPDHKIVFVHSDMNAQGHVDSLLDAAKALKK